MECQQCILDLDDLFLSYLLMINTIEPFKFLIGLWLNETWYCEVYDCIPLNFQEEIHTVLIRTMVCG